MLEKIRKLKDRKGFTLVELIVVLVILAILAALLVPALTGYIDKANQEKVIAECRSVVVAAQTTASEYYGLNKTLTDKNDADFTTNVQSALAQIKTLSEAANTWEYKITIGDVGSGANVEHNVVTEVVFDDGTSTVTYTKTGVEAGEYSTVGKHTGDTAAANANSTLNAD